MLNKMEEYIECLSTGGELIVNRIDWKIKYYFPGPDRRYTGTFFYIPSTKIDSYISAWQNNYIKYRQLKNLHDGKGTISIIGEEKMKISSGGVFDGVCIDNWHMCIRDESKIKEIIADYLYAKKRAKEMQAILKQI